MFSTGLFEARYSLSDDIAAMIALHTVEDELQRAEQRFWGGNLGALMSALHCPTTDLLIGQSFVADYPFSMMAHDEEQVGAAAPPPIMESSWDVARSSGMWWPFDHIAIMSERPAEIHVDEEKLLHRGDGPAVVFRDGWLVYAWKGKAVPERWILHPEVCSIPGVQGLRSELRKICSLEDRQSGGETAGGRTHGWQVLLRSLSAR